MLVGREPETAAIDRMLADARTGRGSALVLRGEAGVGKSALLDHAGQQADGFIVLRGVGVEGESELAYAALHQVLRPVFDRIDRLPEPQAEALRAAFALSSGTVDERFRVSLGVLGLLSEVAEEQPVLCVVDDAQWLDRASADALLFASRRVEAESVAVLFAARDDPDREFVADGLPDLRVNALNANDSRRLLAARLGSGVSAGAVEWLVHNANGNPLALMELPLTLTAGQLDGRTSIAGRLAPTTSVEQAFLSRVEGLPQSTRSLLVLAACEATGARATVERAARELGLDISDLGPAESAGLVQVDSEQLAFRHPLVRAAVYRSAGFTERESSHRTLAVAAAAEHDADRAAWHRAAATIGTDEAVAAELEQAAERARLRSGFAAASSALERSATLSPDPAQRARRLLSAATAAWTAGQPERATALLDQAEPDLADLRLQAESDALRGIIGWRCGSLDDGCRILTAGAAKIAAIDPARALEMFADAAVACWDAGDYGRLLEIGDAVTALPSTDSDVHVVLGTVLVGSVRLCDARQPDDPVAFHAAIARAIDFDEPRLLVWAAIAAELSGEHGLENALLNRSASLARSWGAVDVLTTMLESVAVQGFLNGDLSVTSEASEGLRLAVEAGLSNAANLHRATLAWLAAVHGDEAACRAHADEVMVVARQRGHGIANAIADWALALLELGTGRPDDAAKRLTNLAAAPPGTSHPFYTLVSAPDLVEANIRAGRRREAEVAAGVLDAFARADSAVWLQALAARCRAMLADGVTAETEFGAALDYHALDVNPFERARTHLLYGEFLRRERRRSDAREQLRAALALFESLRADPWAERARAELRATGETARKRDPSTAEDLTPQELQIARLVAEGSSNKDVAAHLFLSPRTVEYHLRKVFAKLGIASRAELIRHGVAARSLT